MTENETPPRVLSDQEWRLLWITFLGGLAAILVGAGLLGLSFAVERWIFHGDQRRGPWVLSVDALFTLVIIWMIRVVTRGVNWRAWQEAGWWGRTVILTQALLVALAAVSVLAWIGLAAGVR